MTKIWTKTNEVREGERNKKYYHQNPKRTLSDRNGLLSKRVTAECIQKKKIKYEKYSPKRFTHTQIKEKKEKNKWKKKNDENSRQTKVNVSSEGNKNQIWLLKEQNNEKRNI